MHSVHVTGEGGADRYVQVCSYVCKSSYWHCWCH